jgi:hypothetical protein
LDVEGARCVLLKEPSRGSYIHVFRMVFATQDNIYTSVFIYIIRSTDLTLLNELFFPQQTLHLRTRGGFAGDAREARSESSSREARASSASSAHVRKNRTHSRGESGSARTQRTALRQAEACEARCVEPERRGAYTRKRRECVAQQAAHLLPSGPLLSSHFASAPRVRIVPPSVLRASVDPARRYAALPADLAWGRDRFAWPTAAAHATSPCNTARAAARPTHGIAPSTEPRATTTRAHDTASTARAHKRPRDPYLATASQPRAKRQKRMGDRMPRDRPSVWGQLPQLESETTVAATRVSVATAREPARVAARQRATRSADARVAFAFESVVRNNAQQRKASHSRAL